LYPCAPRGLGTCRVDTRVLGARSACSILSWASRSERKASSTCLRWFKPVDWNNKATPTHKRVTNGTGHFRILLRTPVSTFATDHTVGAPPGTPPRRLVLSFRRFGNNLAKNYHSVPSPSPVGTWGSASSEHRDALDGHQVWGSSPTDADANPPRLDAPVSTSPRLQRPRALSTR